MTKLGLRLPENEIPKFAGLCFCPAEYGIDDRVAPAARSNGKITPE